MSRRPIRPGELLSWAIVRAVALGCVLSVLLVLKDGGLAHRADEPPTGVLPVYELPVERAPAIEPQEVGP